MGLIFRAFLIVKLISLSGCIKLREVEQLILNSEVKQNCDATASPFGGGDGSSNKPFLICTVNQLLQLTDLTLHYELKADLDLNVAFNPIGTYDAGFSGTFNGNGYSISNWTYSASDLGDAASAIQTNLTHPDYSVGFFRTLENGAIVKNLNLVHITLRGRYYTGGLVGVMKSGSSIDNCTVTTSGAPASASSATTGLVIGFNDIPTASGATGNTGGLVGLLMANATINKSSFNGVVRGAMVVGGLVGDVKGVVSKSSSSGAVLGRDGNTGGLAGNVAGVGSRVENSFTSSIVTEAAGNGGGFVGSVNADGLVIDSYSNGSMTGNTYGTGGFVGYIRGINSKISKCYSSGTVTGSMFVGGFVGSIFNSGYIEDSYSIANVIQTGTSIYAYTGGFAGQVSFNSTVAATLNRVYAAGSIVSSTSLTGSLVGYLENAGIITNSFGLETLSANGLSSNSNTANTTGSSSLSLSSMQNGSTYSNAGWDLTNIWTISAGFNNGLPTNR